MTNFEPNERINSQQALSHSWVTQKEVTFLALNSIDKIRSVKNTETFIDVFFCFLIFTEKFFFRLLKLFFLLIF